MNNDKLAALIIEAGTNVDINRGETAPEVLKSFLEEPKLAAFFNEFAVLANRPAVGDVMATVSLTYLAELQMKAAKWDALQATRTVGELVDAFQANQ